mgnify:CR=1 FL=1
MRYQNKHTLIIANKMYQETLIDRGVNFIEIEQAPELIYPTVRQIQQLEIVGHTWKTGDRLYKLAHRYYNDSQLWWIIAFFNKKPTEAHFRLGSTVRIPLPLDKIIDFIGY